MIFPISHHPLFLTPSLTSLSPPTPLSLPSASPLSSPSSLPLPIYPSLISLLSSLPLFLPLLSPSLTSFSPPYPLSLPLLSHISLFPLISHSSLISTRSLPSPSLLSPSPLFHLHPLSLMCPRSLPSPSALSSLPYMLSLYPISFLSSLSAPSPSSRYSHPSFLSSLPICSLSSLSDLPLFPSPLICPLSPLSLPYRLSFYSISPLSSPSALSLLSLSLSPLSPCPLSPALTLSHISLLSSLLPISLSLSHLASLSTLSPLYLHISHSSLFPLSHLSLPVPFLSSHYLSHTMFMEILSLVFLFYDKKILNSLYHLINYNFNIRVKSCVSFNTHTPMIVVLHQFNLLPCSLFYNMYQLSFNKMAERLQLN